MSGAEILRAERVTVAYRGGLGCEGIDFSVRAGEIFVLLGRAGAGKTTILRCAAGELRPSEGSMTILGLGARNDRRRLRRSVRTLESAGDLAAALARGGEGRLFLVDDIRIPYPDAGGAALRNALSRAAETAVLAATDDSDTARALADRVAILRAGRLIAEAQMGDLLRGFRRIRYRNERTPTREDYGTELDEFDCVRVRVRGWGIEAIVSNATDARLDRLRNRDGVLDVESSEMTLAEIFDALAPATSSSRPSAIVPAP